MRRVLPEDIEVRDDLVLFLRAGHTATRHGSFYASQHASAMSTSFLHAYVCACHRRRYARCLATGLTDHMAAGIVFQLLTTTAPGHPIERSEEGQLIAAALRRMPPQRVYRLFTRLRVARVNHRRCRATIRTWLGTRDLAFDAVKYRRGLRDALRHAHLRPDAEVADFVFNGARSRTRWDHPLLDKVRQTYFSKEAVYALPYTVAEGIAARRGISRSTFLARIAPQLTAGERRRMMTASTKGRPTRDALSRMPLDRLCRYVLSLPRTQPTVDQPVTRADLADDLSHALSHATRRVAVRMQVGRRPRSLAVVLDRSHSMGGAPGARNHPLAVAMGVALLARQLCASATVHWTHPVPDLHSLHAFGPTDLATPLLAALRHRPEEVWVVSDGMETGQQGEANEVMRIWRTRLARHASTRFIHFNPVFEATSLEPRSLGSESVTLGIRRAADLARVRDLAHLHHPHTTLSAVDAWLDACTRRTLAPAREVA